MFRVKLQISCARKKVPMKNCLCRSTVRNDGKRYFNLNKRHEHMVIITMQHLLR